MATLSRRSGEQAGTRHAAQLLSSKWISNSRPRLRMAWRVALCLILGVSSLRALTAAAARKEQARTQYETAERMREALNGRPADERTRKAYQKVADAFRKVYYVSPASSKADASVVAVSNQIDEPGLDGKLDPDLRVVLHQPFDDGHHNGLCRVSTCRQPD